jgi:hypothetical protein
MSNEAVVTEGKPVDTGVVGVDNTDGAKVKNLQPANYDTLRVLPLDVLDSMIAYVYHNSREAIELYLTLVRAREENLIKTRNK